MKTIYSNIEGSWLEIKPLELTPEDLELSHSEDESLQSERKLLLDRLNELRSSPATSEDSLIAESKYSEVKPELVGDQVYQLIDFTLIISEKTTSGILNCRIGTEHKQIRF